MTSAHSILQVRNRNSLARPPLWPHANAAINLLLEVSVQKVNFAIVPKEIEKATFPFSRTHYQAISSCTTLP